MHVSDQCKNPKKPKTIDLIHYIWIFMCYAYFTITHLQCNYVLWKCPVLHCFANTSQIDAKNSCIFWQFLRVLYNWVGGGENEGAIPEKAVRSSTLMHFSVFSHISICGTWNCVILWLKMWTREFGSCVFNVLNLLFLWSNCTKLISTGQCALRFDDFLTTDQ